MKENGISEIYRSNILKFFSGHNNQICEHYQPQLNSVKINVSISDQTSDNAGHKTSATFPNSNKIKNIQH